MNEAEIWREFGKLFIKINAFDDAIGALGKALEVGEQTAWVYTNLGIAYYQKGYYEIAQGYFEKSMELSDSDTEKSEILKWLGDLYVHMRKYRRAAMVYETADVIVSPVMPLEVDTSPAPIVGERPKADQTPAQKNPSIHFEPPRNSETSPAQAPWITFAVPGSTHPKAEPIPVESATNVMVWEPAPEEMSQRAIPETVQTMTESMSHPVETEQPGREPKEIEVYRAVTAANPSNDRAWLTLGNHYKNYNRLEEAQAAYETAIRLNPAIEAYHYQLGLVLIVQKKYEAAVTALLEVIKLRSNHMLAHVALAGCYRRLGRDAEMKRHADIAASSMQKESNYNRACFESICGNTARAFDFLKAAVMEDGIDKDMLLNDPDLDFIRDEPRYPALIKSLDI